MYQLVSHVADGLGKLKSLLEKHICTQGLSAIEKCGDSALNVSLAVITVLTVICDNVILYNCPSPI